jgi:dTDP-3-amino-3,4,6-trideoxy-alpha-D-glucose transaminase
MTERGGGTAGTGAADRGDVSDAPVAVPFTEMDHRDPALLSDLLEAIEGVARRAAFTLGDEVAAFETEFAAYCGAEHGIGVASGTDALLLTLRALDLRPGDEVIVPANTFIATAEAVALAGATPRLVDVDPVSHLLTVETVKAAWSERTRCVIPVHLYGRTVDLDPIVEFAHARGVAVVEDACQAHGAWYGERRVGTIGDAGCFSFYPSKNLGGWGDGGAVVTSDTALADRLRLLRSHGERARHDHRICGTTARLDGIQAAVLRVKLRRLEGWNEARRTVADRLTAALDRTVVTPPAPAAADRDHVFHLYVVECDDREALRRHLTEHGIASGVHYPVPIHLQPAFEYLGMCPGSLPTAERLSGRIASLPLFPGMHEESVGRVADAVNAFGIEIDREQAA